MTHDAAEPVFHLAFRDDVSCVRAILDLCLRTGITGDAALRAVIDPVPADAAGIHTVNDVVRLCVTDDAAHIDRTFDCAVVAAGSNVGTVTRRTGDAADIALAGCNGTGIDKPGKFQPFAQSADDTAHIVIACYRAFVAAIRYTAAFIEAGDAAGIFIASDTSFVDTACNGSAFRSTDDAADPRSRTDHHGAFIGAVSYRSAV